MKKKRYTIDEVLVAILIVALLLFIVGKRSLMVKKNAYRIICASNLRDLGSAMRQYATDHDGNYPTPEKWCDLLLKCNEITERKFICKTAEEGRCHYAMNPNCEPNSSLDMVLLFETKGGWNRYGGADILTIENHLLEGCKGCNVLTNNGRVRFVEPEKLGKLKWGVEQKE